MEDDGEDDRAFAAYRRALAADPTHVELAAKIALELASRGEVAEGLDLLKETVRQAPRAMLLPLCMAQIYWKYLKKPPLALRYAHQALELEEAAHPAPAAATGTASPSVSGSSAPTGPSHPGPYLTLLELYTEEKQPAKAAQIIECALNSGSQSADFWLQLGEAVALFAAAQGEKLAGQSPSGGQAGGRPTPPENNAATGAHGLLGSDANGLTGSDESDGPPESARPSLLALRALPDEKLAQVNLFYQKALQCDPGDAETAEKCAGFYFESRQYAVAIPLLRRLAAALEKSDDFVAETGGNPAEPGEPLRGVAELDEPGNVYEKLARALQETGQLFPAQAVLERMVARWPRRIDGWALLGDTRLLSGKADAAIAAYREVIRLDPDVAPAYLYIAELEMRQRRPGPAIEALTQARAQFPGNALITYTLAADLARARRFAESLPVFEAVVAEAPESKPGLLNGAFYFAYGMAADQAGERGRAVAALQKSIALGGSKLAEACNYLGYMWVERGERLAEAGAYIRRAVEMAPDNGAYLDSLGWFHYKTRDFPKAVEQLQKAAALLPGDPIVNEHLGDALQANREPEKAAAAWRKALEADPANPRLKEKLRPKPEKPNAQPKPSPKFSPKKPR